MNLFSYAEYKKSYFPLLGFNDLFNKHVETSAKQKFVL